MRSESLARVRPWWAADVTPWAWDLFWESSEQAFTDSTKEEIRIWKPLGQNWVHQDITIQDHCSGNRGAPKIPICEMGWPPSVLLTDIVGTGVWLPRDEDLDRQDLPPFCKQGQSSYIQSAGGTELLPSLVTDRWFRRKGQADPGESGKGYCKDSAGGQKWECEGVSCRNGGPARQLTNCWTRWPSHPLPETWFHQLRKRGRQPRLNSTGRIGLGDETHICMHSAWEFAK